MLLQSDVAADDVAAELCCCRAMLLQSEVAADDVAAERCCCRAMLLHDEPLGVGVQLNRAGSSREVGREGKQID